jgi:pimeloyl-ACP methyl ester carboxylesterase
MRISMFLLQNRRQALAILFFVGQVLFSTGCATLEKIIEQVGSLRGTTTDRDREDLREDVHNDKLIVFVHGFNSSSKTAWGKFPSLLLGDDELKDFNIVLYGYRTKSCVETDSIREEGNLLASFLHDTIRGNHQKYQQVVLVGHSMGGLVIMRALLTLNRDHPLVLDEHDFRVATFGTLYLGVENTGLLPPFCRNKQTEGLALFNTDLHETIRDWTQGFNQGREGRRITPSVPFYTFYGKGDKFVSPASACGYNAKNCEVVDGDHTAIVKPETRKHLAYSKLKWISLEVNQQPQIAQIRYKSEIVIQGVMPIYMREVHRFEKLRFVWGRLGFIIKVYNASSTSQTVNLFKLEGCIPAGGNVFAGGEEFIDRHLLPNPMDLNERLFALMRTAVQKVLVSGAIRTASRVLPPEGVGYVGVWLPLPLGSSGARMIVGNSASLQGHCSKIPEALKQPSILQLVVTGPVHRFEPRDIATSFRDGSLKMTLQVGGKHVPVDPSLLGKLYSIEWKQWRSLDLARMYEVPDTEYLPLYEENEVGLHD